jgi:hypothetical protein
MDLDYYERKQERYIQATQKLDYFLTGLASATLAYSVQTFHADKYDTFIWIAPIAWLLLCITISSGLYRVIIYTFYLGEQAHKALIELKIYHGTDLKEKLSELEDSIEFSNRHSNAAFKYLCIFYFLSLFSLVVLETINLF